MPQHLQVFIQNNVCKIGSCGSMALGEFEQAANVTILTQEDCQSRFTGYKIYPTMLCAGGGETDACQVIKFTKTMTSNKIFRKFLSLMTH